MSFEANVVVVGLLPVEVKIEAKDEEEEVTLASQTRKAKEKKVEGEDSSTGGRS